MRYTTEWFIQHIGWLTSSHSVRHGKAFFLSFISVLLYLFMHRGNFSMCFAANHDPKSEI